jgi:hypothetical protein
VAKVVALAAWFVALFWLWLLLVGEWNGQEITAAAVAAAVGAILAEAAGRVAGVTPTLPSRRVLARSKTVPLDVVVDFAVIVRVLVTSLVRRRVVRGSFLVRRGAPDDPAWAMWIATISPNAYVVDVDTDADTVLVHDLVPRRASEAPL